MKTVALALVMLLAGVNAIPFQVDSVDIKDSRSVEQVVVDYLTGLLERLRAHVDDPTEREGGSVDYNINEQTGVSAYYENLLVTGITDINIDKVSFSGGLLYVALSAPRVAAYVGDAGAEVRFRGRNINGQISGSLAINDIRAAAGIRLGLSGYLVEDLELSGSIGGIDSNLNVSIRDRDVSDIVNRFLGETLPSFLDRHQELITRIISRIAKYIVDRLS